MTGGVMTPSPRHQLIARRRALALLAGSAGLTLAAACAPIEPPDDKRVRQAFNLALDRQRILDRVYAGVGETACIPFPKTSPGYHAATAGSCTFDLDASRKLLTEAGS